MVIFSQMVICTNRSIKPTVNVQLTSDFKYNFRALSTTPDFFPHRLPPSAALRLPGTGNSFQNAFFELAEHCLQVTQKMRSKFLL